MKSFRESVRNLRMKMWVLMDACPGEYEDLFTRYFDPKDLVLVNLPGIGNTRTFAKQIDILLEQNDADLVYFAEDDYFYLPNHFHLMIDFLKTYPDVDFVTPYDHLDCYTLELHRRPKWLRVCGNHHWRTAATTCLTFLTRRKTLQQAEQAFRSYQQTSDHHRTSYQDASMWLSLTKEGVVRPIDFFRWVAKDPWLAKILLKVWWFGWSRLIFGKRYRLWAPVPGIATHLDALAMSPAIDWPMLMREQLCASEETLTR